MMLVMALTAFFLSTDRRLHKRMIDRQLPASRLPGQRTVGRSSFVDVPVYMANSKELGAFTFGFKYDTYHMEFLLLNRSSGNH